LEIERRGSPSDHVTIHAPSGGIVIHKHAVEGMYVKTGMRIYTIADLSRVWVKINAYESDLPWVRYGQTVEFETAAYPGETFDGRIAFIDPVLDAKTRTVKVRVNVPNESGKLKPGMFVRAVVGAKVSDGGKVAEADLAGKWISPMHPEVVKEGPGACDVCGMPLVRAETLGYVSPDESKLPLVIPASAPLVTGERAVVYVLVAGKEGVFEGREVVLGPRAGDRYVVKSGLEEGERVVTNGAFKIDSALQILAKPSMMNPEEEEPGSHQEESQAAAFDTSVEFRRQLDGVFEAYLAAQTALSRDDLTGARRAGRSVQEALKSVDMALLDGPAHAAWMKELRALATTARALEGSEDFARAREAFASLSETLMAAAGRFGTSGERPLFRLHCPMAFGNKGADWLATTREVENPYFGAAMFRCGEVTEVISEGSGPLDEQGAEND
jgi:Cu(I)/Ag(I) efflux system membrane fusion protein